MNPTLVRDIETILKEPSGPATLKCASPLIVASRMLSAASGHAPNAATVVGVLGGDDVDAFRSLVTTISDEYGLDARVSIQLGSYSVRFSRRASEAIQRS